MALRKPLVRINGKDRQLPAGDELAGTGVDFTIIYPNGGSAASPANITINTRYVVANPFPGYQVITRVELLVGGGWRTMSYSAYAATASIGVDAGQDNDGDIIVLTGSGSVSNVQPIHFFSGPTRATLTSAPCRVKVWKVKGAIA